MSGERFQLKGELENVSIDDRDKQFADQHGFKISIEGSRYVVTDPKLPKKAGRYEGGNLRALIHAAIRGREHFEKESPKKVESAGQPKSNVVPIRAPVVPKPLKQGKLYHIKVAVYHNREASNEQILAILKEKGMETSIAVIAAVRTDFLSTLRFLEEVGRVKPKLNGEDQ